MLESRALYRGRRVYLGNRQIRREFHRLNHRRRSGKEAGKHRHSGRSSVHRLWKRRKDHPVRGPGGHGSVVAGSQRNQRAGGPALVFLNRRRLPETIEGYPQRQKELSTKGHEGRRRATKGLEKTQEGSAKGRAEQISTKGAKGSVTGAKDESAKGFQGIGKDSKGVREGPRRTLRFPTNAHSIIEPVRFLWRSVLSC